MSRFKGTGVAMVTPFLSNGEIDRDALIRLTEHLINGGIEYLVVQGTTGESATLTEDEKRKVLDTVLETNDRRLPVVFGIGGNNTRAVCRSLTSWGLDGVDGILSVSPYYNKPTQDGIFQHYRAIDESTDLPVIVYNVPGRTASNITAETTLRLANDLTNMVAVKEASGDQEQIMEIIRNKPDDFEVISGDDAITLPMIACGALGVMSVAGNAFPAEFSDMVRFALTGNLEGARENHYRLLELIKHLFIEGNPAGVKEVLKHLGICDNHVHLPLVPVSDSTSQKLLQLITENYLMMAR
jgi:4-hydroxy-tetrahydrodipicolinate synthase